MARVNYYGWNYSPALIVDGTTQPSAANETQIRNAINARRAIASPCTVEVSTAIIAGDSIEATVLVTAESDMHDTSTRLYVALTHRCYRWSAEYWWYPFRDMEPNTTGESFQLDADSTFEFVATFYTDPGWDLNDLSVVAFVQLYNTKEVLQSGFNDVSKPSPPLFINEFMADNTTTIQDPQGEYEDWVEIYNPGPDAINLYEMHLTNDLTDPDKWTFPDTSLPANSFLIVWCDGDIADPGLHTNFQLSQTGADIGLFMDVPTCYTVLDSLHFGSQSADISYGRQCDSSMAWEFFTNPTPENANIEGYSVSNLTAVASGSDIRLHWLSTCCATSYTIYRHDTFPFDPSSSDSIGVTSDTTYLDVGILLSDSTAFYRVVARQ